MTSAELAPNVHALRLERGEDIHETLQGFCEARGIKNAVISGIGSIENPQLAHYGSVTKQFAESKLPGIYEVTSLSGNVGLLEGRTLSHLHVTIAGPDMIARGSHLVAGACSATLEIVVQAFATEYTKAFEESVGLNVWQFPRP